MGGTHILSPGMQEVLLHQTSTEQGMVVQQSIEQGVVVQWGRVPEGRTWDTCTRDQYIVQSSRGKVLVETHTHHLEGVAWDTLYLVYLQLSK